jgi:alpha-maltose-1-phosphate synthase
MAGPLIQQSGGFDLLCAQSHQMFPTLLAALGSVRSKTPFIVTNHGFSVHRDRIFNAFQSLYLNVVCRWIFRRADYVINFTQTQRNQVISLGVAPRKAVVIPSGVDTKLFEPNLSKEDPYSILWVGRLVPEKGLEYLVKAMPGIIRKIPQARLRIVGYGDRGHLMKLVSELALERKVDCLGVLEGEKLATVFNESAIFVLPSLSEALSWTVLEAMACAKPVIATAGIGHEEVLGPAGLFFPPGSVSEIAKATVYLLRNKSLRLKLGKIARRNVEQKYSWTKTAALLDRLYENAVAKRSG